MEKEDLKKIYMKINPTYRKLCAVQEQLDQVNRRLNELVGYQTRNQYMLWMLQKENPKTLRETQKDFWHNYPKADGDMQILQKANLFMMKEMKRICDANGIKFWLHGGTLIGAIRHAGFIPWDDDVDVAMTRKDLERFIDICNASNEYKVGLYYHDNETFSRAYQFRRRNDDIPCFIDIFVFDFYSGHYPENNAIFRKQFAAQRSQMVNDFLTMNNRPTVENIGAYHFGPFTKTDKERVDQIIDAHIQNMGNPYEGDSLYYSIENYPFPYPLIPLEKIFPLKKCVFEDCEFDVPGSADFYLKGYGDYWQMPKDFGVASHFYYFEPHIETIKSFIEDKIVQGEINCNE